ncbi:MAG: acetate kinase [Clostridia bacterium]|nr:acetate kinase [Clostridia bacterium]MBQ3090938.1 acetate kinase [Clostridia bacterium]
MNILVINAGSSSLKYQLFDMETKEIKAKGLCERIGIDGKFTYKPQLEGKEALNAIDVAMPTHSEAIQAVLNALVDEKNGVVASMKEIDAVGHRVLHGGQKFSESVLINEPVIEAIKECIPLGPLHNPANLMGIEACAAVMPGVPQVAVFDTAFHQSMPKSSYMYAIPYEMYEKYGIRRYGFHGTSHRYVSGQAAELLGGAEGTKIITCHLGNGSSMAAVKDGKCFDTSMGLTPLEGVPMGTRSGSIDPAIVEVIANNEGMTPSQVLNMLNKKSGVMGLSGVSSDFRDLDNAAAEGNERAQLALDVFAYSVKKYVGSYAAALGGCDAIVFTAGLGENSPEMRAKIASGLEYMGIEIDLEKNAKRGTVDITGANSKVKVFVIPTNEELVIAMDTEAIVKAL